MNRVRGTKKFFGLKEWNLKKDLGLHFLRACSASEGREPAESAAEGGSVLTEAMGEVGSGGGSTSADDPVVEVLVEPVVEPVVEAAGEVGAGGGTLDADADAAAGVETVTARARDRDSTAVPFIGRRPLYRLEGLGVREWTWRPHSFPHVIHDRFAGRAVTWHDPAGQ
ncbi:hypothetical protein ACFQVD_33345 [Streptosporangium amethystogenes subsp. fukuiense]|uniref:Uncharacterized protein n=1 Tax=Streptosporangium amethystogenes subsp. fukuiense TaxID=698418 RepID=A0ABW2TB86_9ACTN